MGSNVEIDPFSIIKISPIFSSFDNETLKTLAAKFETIHVRKDHVLLHQGALTDDFYLLAKGSMVVTVITENHEERIIGKIPIGDTVGELSALSQEPRSATVKALENCILLKLASRDFKEFCYQHPEIIAEFINMFNFRSRKMLQLLTTEEAPVKHVAIIPAHKRVLLDAFAQQLTTLVKNTPHVALLSDYDEALYETYPTPTKLRQFVEQLEIEHHTILFLLKSHTTMLSKICSKNPAKVYVIANSQSRVYLSPFVPKKISNALLVNKTKAELVLLHNDGTKLPQRTSRWLKFDNIGLHHHIRMNNSSDFERLLRFMTGQAIGLVLGGGGVRSWAHIGALKALREMQMPIDILVGTSAGALAACYYAAYETYEDSHFALRKLSEITRHTVSIRNFTWPAVSIFNGKKYTEQLKRMFGKVRIENLWLPAICVSCNLSHNTQVTSRTGYIWKTIRSSTAVPAIFPPVVINGEIHLDGGIINNLPVDIMKKLIGHKGTIIAIELTRSAKDEQLYNFPPILPFWKTLLAKLRIGFRDYHFPHFVDTFLKSLLAGSSVKQAENSLDATVLISPDISKFSLLHISREQENELMQIGYDTTMAAIKKWKHKNANPEWELL